MKRHMTKYAVYDLLKLLLAYSVIGGLGWLAFQSIERLPDVLLYSP